jgi:hypothetical protein
MVFLFLAVLVLIAGAITFLVHLFLPSFPVLLCFIVILVTLGMLWFAMLVMIGMHVHA